MSCMLLNKRKYIRCLLRFLRAANNIIFISLRSTRVLKLLKIVLEGQTPLMHKKELKNPHI